MIFHTSQVVSKRPSCCPDSKSNNLSQVNWVPSSPNLGFTGIEFLLKLATVDSKSIQVKSWFRRLQWCIYVNVYTVYTVYIYILYYIVIKGNLVGKLPNYGPLSWPAFSPSCQPHHHIVDEKCTGCESSICSWKCKQCQRRSTFGRWGRQNAHETVARARFHINPKKLRSQSTFGRWNWQIDSFIDLLIHSHCFIDSLFCCFLVSLSHWNHSLIYWFSGSSVHCFIASFIQL